MGKKQRVIDAGARFAVDVHPDSEVRGGSGRFAAVPLLGDGAVTGAFRQVVPEASKLDKHRQKQGTSKLTAATTTEGVKNQNPAEEYTRVRARTHAPSCTTLTQKLLSQRRR